MAYDASLEKRLDQLIAKRTDFHKQKMFGGLGYLLRGHMCFGIWKDSLILRVGEDQAQRILKEKNTKPFDITGRAMKAWAMILPAGMTTDKDLKQQVMLAVDYVAKLPRR